MGVLPVLQVKDGRLERDGRPLKLWGLRVASAPVREAWAEELLASLPIYREHGINALYICYQGSDGGFAPCFTPDGFAFAAAPAPVSGREEMGTASGVGIANRVKKIVRAAAEHGMAVVVSPFCGRAADFASGNLPLLEVLQHAAELVGRELAQCEGALLVDLTGDLGTRLAPATVKALGAAVRRGDPDGRLLRCASQEGTEVDVLLAEEPVRRSAKPVLVAATFGPRAGGYLEHKVDGTEPPARPGYAVEYDAGSAQVRRYFGLTPEGSRETGLYQAHASGVPEEGYRAGRAAYRRLIRQVKEYPSTSGAFFHLPAWFEGSAHARGAVGRGPGRWECRFTPGGDGTLQAPGIRWLLREVAGA